MVSPTNGLIMSVLKPAKQTMGYFYSPFRKSYQPEAASVCPFCAEDILLAQTVKDQSGALIQNEHYRWVVNAYPKFAGHTMLVPTTHLTALADETEAAVLARHRLLVRVLPILERAFPHTGIEYFLQTGDQSASSVAHLHWHIVPAHPDDELRSFEKLGHFYTTEPTQEKVVLFPKRITMSPDELLTHLTKHT